MLRAVPDQPSDLQLLRRNIVTADVRLAGSRGDVATQYRQGCRLPGAVDPKEPKALSVRDAEREVADGDLWAGRRRVDFSELPELDNLSLRAHGTVSVSESSRGSCVFGRRTL